MFEALAKSFPMAFGIAMSSTSLIAIILLLMTPNAKENSIAYLIGWMVGVFGVGLIIILLPGVIAGHGGMSTHTGIVKIILGILLILAAVPVWFKRPKKGQPVKKSKLLDKVDEFGVGKSFVIGILFSAFSLKNSSLIFSGAAHIDESTLVDYVETLLGLFIFALISSITVIIPIAIYFLIPNKMNELFLSWKDWLIKNNAMLLIVTFVLSGALMIYLGLGVYHANTH